MANEQKSPAAGNAGLNPCTSDDIANTAKIVQKSGTTKQGGRKNDCYDWDAWGTRLQNTVFAGTHDELPIWGLPKPLQDYICHVTDVYKCPREFVTVAVFSAISTAAGTNISITGKYDNSLCLWFVDVAPTGGSKSRPTKEVLRPIDEINKQLNEEYVEARKAAGKDDEQPRPKRIIFKDATREVRALRMSDYPHGSLLYRDEFSGLFKDFCRYSPKSGEREELLSVFDSDSILVDRKGSDPVFVEKPFLNILGGIQPEILTDAFGDTDVSSGLFGRFLFAWPIETEYPDYYEAVVSDDYRRLWANTIEYIYSITPTTLTMPGVTMTAYADYYNLMQSRMRSLGEGDQEGAIYSKAEIQVIRLAGVVHIAKMAFDPDAGTAIDAPTMCYAGECLEYFVECGKRALDKIGSGQKKSNKTESLRRVMQLYPKANISLLADALDVGQPWLSAIKNGRK